MILTGQALVDKARELAECAHAGSTRADKVTPSITHPKDVAMRFLRSWSHTLDEDVFRGEALALAHDICENTDNTVDDLSALGLESIASELRLLTNEEGLSYLDYILRLRDSGNALAITVKLCDFASNESTLDKVPSKGRAKAMLCKWQLARYILCNP